jgi:hypothetical protein
MCKPQDVCEQDVCEQGICEACASSKAGRKPADLQLPGAGRRAAAALARAEAEADLPHPDRRDVLPGVRQFR